MSQYTQAKALFEFLKESNHIEGIPPGDITEQQIELSESFLDEDEIGVADMVMLATLFQPDAELRDKFGLNVRVGNHRPPLGAPEIRERLNDILDIANSHQGDPEAAYKVHQHYERLHPFTDGNGRTGRMLWLWMMNGKAPLGFLHTWYYQSLQYRPDSSR